MSQGACVALRLEPAAARPVVIGMSIDPDRLGESGKWLADAGRLAERAAHALGPASSLLGRLAAAVSVAQLATQMLPAGGRLLRRHPVACLLVVAGLAGALYLAQEPPHSSRLRLG